MEQNNSLPLNTQEEDIPVQKKPHSLFYKKYAPFFVLLLVILIFGLGIIISPSHQTKTSIVEQNRISTTNATNAQITQAPQQKVSYTNAQLSTLQGSPRNTTQLPLGDKKYSTTAPQKGYVYLCHLQQGGGGAQESGNWIQGSMWNLDEKPSVEGNKQWPNAQFSNTISGNNRIITGNDLPLNTTTGTFPIQSSDPAYHYDRNPNSLEAHAFTLTLPVNPTYSQTPTCMGGEVGIMLNGVPLFDGFDAEYRDAAAHEIQDSCDGHPQEKNEYHYHSLSRCFKDIKETTVLGFALDGYPITGPVLPNGNYLTTNDLDVCHGMTSQIILDGKQVTTYHYVMTEDFPYSVSCFHAKPVQMQVIAMQQGSQSKSQQPQQSGGKNQTGHQQSGTMQQPPLQAINACSNGNSGSSCSFSTPNGTISGTCQTPPNQTSLACVPR